MSPWTVNEGIRHQDIPFLSHVPRKPKPLGAEIKTTADGESGAIIRCELALKYKRRRGAPTVTEPFRDEFGATSAQCLRLVEPWLESRRCFGADAHFIGMDSIEALLEKGLFPFGNIKQIRSRFPVDQLEQHCGPESGDWSVMTTRVLDDKLVYGVGHRRGGVVHTYVSTHGSTRRGRDQAHRDDADDLGHAAPPRKCPKILNDWTQAQPHVDKSNRWRQQILGIEERFRTTQFPFRLATTVIVGMSIASAHVLHRYHNLNDTSEGEVQEFRDFVEEVALDAMTNTYDEDHAPMVAGGPRVVRKELPAPALSRDPHDHLPMAIKQIKAVEGFAGHWQQKCSICKRWTTYACSNRACRNKQFIVPICQLQTTCRGRVEEHGCSAKHSRDPSNTKVVSASAARAVAAKRRRK